MIYCFSQSLNQKAAQYNIHTNKGNKQKMKTNESEYESNSQGPCGRVDYPYHSEFCECIDIHNVETGALCGKPAFLRLITALFGYDITKGMTSSMSDGKIRQLLAERFRETDNDKVVLATIGSTLQICATLATNPLGGQEAGHMDFKKFCGFVKRLYGCDLSGYDPTEIQDFRYHVMAYLKGRTLKEREVTRDVVTEVVH